MSEPKEPTIEFKPVTPGLGFHPFSDGLPYAPIRPQPKRPELASGTGAVAAGPPRIAAPRRAPTATQQAVRTAAATAARLPAPAARISAPSPEPTILESYGLGYLARRAAAYLIDSALNLSACAAAFAIVIAGMDIPLAVAESTDTIALFAVFLLVFNWALITAQEVAFRTTVGKHLFRMTLDSGAAAIFLRAFYFPIGVAFFGVGLVWGLFNRKRRLWHDVMVDAQPTEIARL